VSEHDLLDMAETLRSDLAETVAMTTRRPGWSHARLWDAFHTLKITSKRGKKRRVRKCRLPVSNSKGKKTTKPETQNKLTGSPFLQIVISSPSRT
jgi:hypothetical protein